MVPCSGISPKGKYYIHENNHGKTRVRKEKKRHSGVVVTTAPLRTLTIWKPCRTMCRGASVADVDGIEPDHKEKSRRWGNVFHILDGILSLGLGSFFGFLCVLSMEGKIAMAIWVSCPTDAACVVLHLCVQRCDSQHARLVRLPKGKLRDMPCWS